MELLEISSGAAAIELEKLANANFSEMRLSGGAASYELDFGGVLSRDAEVSIETGISGGVVSVPLLHRSEGGCRNYPWPRGCGRRFQQREGSFSTRIRPERGWPCLENTRRCEAGSLELRTT